MINDTYFVKFSKKKKIVPRNDSVMTKKSIAEIYHPCRNKNDPPCRWFSRTKLHLFFPLHGTAFTIFPHYEIAIDLFFWQTRLWERKGDREERRERREMHTYTEPDTIVIIIIIIKYNIKNNDNSVYTTQLNVI